MAQGVAQVEPRSLLASAHADVNALVQTDEWGSNTLLYYAVIKEQYDVTKLLLEAGARVDIHDLHGRTPLHDAVVLNDERTVSLLLSHGADVNALYHHGDTPLFYASSSQVTHLLVQAGADIHRLNNRGETALAYALETYARTDTVAHWEVVAALLLHGANINRVDKIGNNALHVLAKTPYVHDMIVERLVAVGVDVNGRNERGETPLHVAVQVELSSFDEQEDVSNLVSLLKAGADINAQDKDGYQAIHVALRMACECSRGKLTSARVRCLQVLVSHGAEWGPVCEQFFESFAIRSQKPTQDASANKYISLDVACALRICIERWIAERTIKLPPTDIPEEHVNDGIEATTTYLDKIDKSQPKYVVLRRKICVVGPSNWGKTSLVKSLVADKPSLEHDDDRTIGIDKFKLAFDQPIPRIQSSVRHELTFWDFAGQDEYQVAHALFSSRRTLYLLCIDLKAYAITYLQAQLMTDEVMALDLRMNWYVEVRILRWVRLITARQPDAEFRFVGTKSDLVNSMDEEAMCDLRMRLGKVLVLVSQVQRELTGTVEASNAEKITHLGDTLLASMKIKPTDDLMIASASDTISVAVTKKWLIDLISSSRRSYRMPETYSNVLQMVKKKRAAASTADPSSRIQACLTNANALIHELVAEVEGISTAECRVILYALRDLGDVLWYDDFDDVMLRETVILDPLLLIDFIRQIFNHHEKSEVMRHAKLQELPLWRSLDGDQMLAMKRVLQHFHLAYPTEKEMQADSDLLMPPFWRSKKSAQWLLLGQPLKDPSTGKSRDWRCTVHWEIHVDYGFEDELFDRLVVASYRSGFSRDVGPDYLLYGAVDDANAPYACRLIADWHRTTHKRVLHLEAVLGEEAQAAALWGRFECVCAALSAVFKMFPGLRVSTCARQPSRNRVGGQDYDRPLLRACTTADASWLPPEPTLTKCRDLLTNYRATLH